MSHNWRIERIVVLGRYSERKDKRENEMVTTELDAPSS